MAAGQRVSRNPPMNHVLMPAVAPGAASPQDDPRIGDGDRRPLKGLLETLNRTPPDDRSLAGTNPGARLRRPAVRRRLVRRPCHSLTQGREWPADHLCAVARCLLHVMDVLRQRRPRGVERLRLHPRLSRSDPDVRVRRPADRAHRPDCQKPEPHLGRRLHRGALRQEPSGGRDRDYRLGAGGAAVHRASAQGRGDLHRDAAGPEPFQGSCGRDNVRSRYSARHRARARRVRSAVWHASHRCDRASGRIDACNCGGVASEARDFPRCRSVRHFLYVRRHLRFH